MTIDLSIIILNYNTSKLVCDCLESIKKADKGQYNFEVIVVDNASSDDSVEKIRKYFPHVKIIKNEKNLGFSAGNNRGIPGARGRYLLFLNPDTLVNKDTLVKMLSFMDVSPCAGAATCRVELASGELDDACHRGFPTPWNSFCHFTRLENVFPNSSFFSGYKLGSLDLSRTHEIDALCGAFLIMRREAGVEVGWWDEDYFWYGEDLDLCYRLKEKGWKIYYVPETKIIHYKGAASGLKKSSQNVTTATAETKKRAALASTAVMRIFYKKHYRDKYPALVTWIVFGGIGILEKRRLSKT